jgi:hypothetical protein
MGCAATRRFIVLVKPASRKGTIFWLQIGFSLNRSYIGFVAAQLPTGFSRAKNYLYETS